MRKTFSAFHLVVSLLCVLSLTGVSAYGQIKGGDREEEEHATTNEHPNGVVQDWSRRHIAYPQAGPIQAMIALQHDHRALLSWQAAMRRDWHRTREPRPNSNSQSSLHKDWSISLGAGTTPYGMYPAKYVFDPLATPKCATDYAVFPIDAAGGAAQPNIVAFNNLYSGTVPSPGICNRAVTGTDNGLAATTYWSYNVSAAGGHVPTSPALSADGTKVAFVESATGTPAHFHVLAWHAGDGQATNRQDVTTSPAQITSFAALSPVAGSGTATDLTLGAASDTLSSPFVDYTNDIAYVGNDAGVLFKIKNVFCTSACTPGVGPAPSLDATWPTGTGGGSLTVCAGALSAPVVDNSTGNVFVGCADGKLYGFSPAGASVGTAVSVGDGTATGGVVDSPMLDVVNGFVFAVSGSSGGSAVIVQAKIADLSGARTATVGAGGSFNLHDPAFNEAYFTSATSTRWLLYEWALNAGGANIALYGVGFDASRNMTTGTPSNILNIGGSSPVELSPTTDFFNARTALDLVFVSGQINNPTNFIVTDVTNSFFDGLNGTGREGNGTSGIIVDNDSGSGQGSSLYFSEPSANTAVKVTQVGLN